MKVNKNCESRIVKYDNISITKMFFAKKIIDLPEKEITGKVYGKLTYQAPLHIRHQASEDLIKRYDEVDVQAYRDGIEQIFTGIAAPGFELIVCFLNVMLSFSGIFQD